MRNSEVGYSKRLAVKRHVKGKDLSVVVDGHRAQAEHVKVFDTVDRNDRCGIDHSTSICTNWYY